MLVGGGHPCSWLVRLRGSIAGTLALGERAHVLGQGGFLKTFAWFLRVALVFLEILAGCLLGRCVFHVGSLRVFFLLAKAPFRFIAEGHAYPSVPSVMSAEKPGHSFFQTNYQAKVVIWSGAGISRLDELARVSMAYRRARVHRISGSDLHVVR